MAFDPCYSKIERESERRRACWITNQEGRAMVGSRASQRSEDLNDIKFDEKLGANDKSEIMEKEGACALQQADGCSARTPLWCC